MTQSSSATRDAGDHGMLHGAVLKRVGRVGIRMLAAVALIGGSVAFAGIAGSTTAFAADGACDGVTVVVDSTDIGGELTVACAEGSQPTGRDALLAAGFTATDSQPGFLCAINSMPDPCPEVFDGSFWSYWHSTADGEWTSYQIGADSSAPATGELEGWRYNDGTIPPGIAPADTVAALSPEAPDATAAPDEAAPGSDESATSTSPLTEQQTAQSTVLTIVTVSFLTLIAAFVLFFVVRSRRNGKGSGNSGSSD